MPDASLDNGVDDPFLLVVARMGDTIDDCVLTFEGEHKLFLIREVLDSDHGGVVGEDSGRGKTGDDCYGEAVAIERSQDIEPQVARCLVKHSY